VAISIEDIFIKRKKSFYNLPLPLRDGVGYIYNKIPMSIRYGSFYKIYAKRIHRFLIEKDPQVIPLLQLHLLKKTVNHAVDNIPFYQRFQKITSTGELQQFPVVSKKEFSDLPEQFIDPGSEGHRLRSNTGGSSGTPLSFFLHKHMTRPKEKCHFQWFWGQYGYRPGSKTLMVRGAPLKNNSLFEKQILGNILSISCYELNDRNVNEVIRAIKQFNPQFIHAYPSALRILTDCIKYPCRLGKDVRIKAAFLGSEGLSESNREWFAQFYDTQIVNWYGHSECVLHGGNSPGTEEFYFYPFYGYVELLDEHGNIITEPGKIGRIVGTSFDNYVMPFVRYDTGDLGVLSSKKETPNGLPCVVMEHMEGRSQNIIFLNDKTMVTLTAFIFGQHPPQFSGIREMQLQQDEIGTLLIRVVPNLNWKSDDSETMRTILMRSVSGKIKIDVRIVEQIPKTHQGKHRLLIQNCHV